MTPLERGKSGGERWTIRLRYDEYAGQPYAEIVGGPGHWGPERNGQVLEVVSVAEFSEEHRSGDDGAASIPPQPSDHPASRWVRLVGPWRRVS